LENHPRLYERRDIVVTSNKEDSSPASQIQAQAYFLVKYRAQMLELPMISCYEDLVDGKKYFLPKDREVSAPVWWYEVHSGYEQD